MDCSLKDASKQFQELIENQRENLDYLQELNSTYKAAQQGMWGKAVGLISDMLGDAFGEQIDEILGDELSFENLKSAIQMVALVKPEAFGEALKKEINDIKSFFKDEAMIAEAILNDMNNMIDKLNNEWSSIADSQILKEQQLELNELMNHDVPLAGDKLQEAKNELIAIEEEVYNKNTTRSLTSNNIQHIIDKLNTAKNHLTKDETTSVIESLIKFANMWNGIQENIDKLTNPSSEGYNNLEENFKQIGEDLKSSIEDLLATLRIIRNALNDLDTTDEMIYDQWKSTINHLILNIEEIEDYKPADEIKKSLDQFINSDTITTIKVSYPLVGAAVSETSFSSWEDKANLIKLNRSTWISQIDGIITMLENITQSSASDTIDSIDTIYEPISNSVIESYKTLSAPIWAQLIKGFKEVNFIVNGLIEGKEISKGLLESVTEIKNVVSSLYDVLSDKVDYFNNNTPESNLVSQLGLGNTTQGVINGMTVMADYLGLDHMSELINSGNFSKLLDIDEADANSTQQLLNDLKCLSKASSQTKSIGMEIRKFVINEKQRKENLRKNAGDLLQEGVKNKKEKIKRLQSMNDKFRNKI